MNRRHASLLVVVASSLVLYARTLGFPFSYLDDDELVLADLEFLARPAAPALAFGRPYFPARGRDHAYYRPVVTASLALDARGDGRAPAAYHATNALLHALSACLLLLLLEAEGASLGMALFGALVFVAHPALVATVAWIPGRDDLLLALFALAAWLALLRLEERPTFARAFAHGGCFFLALGSKEAALALPLVFAGRALALGRKSWREALPPWLLAPWGVAVAAYVLLRSRALGPGLGLPELDGASWLGGSRSLLSGIGSLLVPVQLRSVAVPADVPLWPGCVAVCLLPAAFALLGVSRRRLLFALGAFVALALPSVPASRLLVLESRLYLPAIALVFALVECARVLPLAERTRLAAAAFVLAVLGAGAWRTTSPFADRLVLSQVLAAGSPHSSLLQRNLGVAEQVAGHPGPARRAYARALAADPNEPLVHNNLAVLFMAQGQLEDAERELHEELRLHPESSEARQNLALIERTRGR